MTQDGRLQFMDNLKTVLIFLVVLIHAGTVYESSDIMAPCYGRRCQGQKAPTHQK